MQEGEDYTRGNFLQEWEEEEGKAATKIQSNFRGYQTRKKFEATPEGEAFYAKQQERLAKKKEGEGKQPRHSDLTAGAEGESDQGIQWAPWPRLLGLAVMFLVCAHPPIVSFLYTSEVFIYFSVFSFPQD